jgi:hypothetical protein
MEWGTVNRPADVKVVADADLVARRWALSPWWPGSTRASAELQSPLGVAAQPSFNPIR